MITEETKQKISKAKTGTKCSEETKQKMRNQKQKNIKKKLVFLNPNQYYNIL